MPLHYLLVFTLHYYTSENDAFHINTALNIYLDEINCLMPSLASQVSNPFGPPKQKRIVREKDLGVTDWGFLS